MGRKQLILMVRPSGFEPPTFCSGGNAARRNWLFSRLSTQQLNRFSVYPPEKLLGKLLGGCPLQFSSANNVSKPG